ncbi:hypothetical protein P152DRAFT_481820 [Eremomyces bilateralis CBS 781.70]|uniref:Ribosomal protein L9 domain-containing protein n=1 Tax=Eremomyces bilateralis CBS 781.70 TaxID=1392243 RepID=A0A6G1G4S5_9PEZI|nr:uncharacterized protein P152DRAFT_481820 [Eremomyces bilateralis CBS 781.70]KAF1812941.1 hypothetical protein P152DRAFT_481820 [Eremomyces bilateralis CBS 781.70]
MTSIRSTNPFQRCTRCIHLLSTTTTTSSRSPTPTPFLPITQTRTKRRSRDAQFVTVKLLKPVDGFGNTGTILSVKPGFMRNILYPRRAADYVLREEVKRLREEGVRIARDHEFNLEGWRAVKDIAVEESAIESEPAEMKKKASIELLSAERSHELLTRFLPARLTFIRTPIPSTSPSTEPSPPTGPGTPIYGSVSTTDVLVAIMDAIKQDEEASKVVLSLDNLRFVDRAADDATKVKQLGEFVVEVNLRGETEAIRRVVVVRSSAGGKGETGPVGGYVGSEASTAEKRVDL